MFKTDSNRLVSFLALHNSAWQAYREGMNTFGSGPNPFAANANVWAGGPATNALYGGRMNADRRMEVVTVTQVKRNIG